MTAAYHPLTGLLVTFDGQTIAINEDMTIAALGRYLQELEALYG